ncbi:hypothetical protein K3X48_08120 [Aliiroseovarius crassostreae]|uniref:Isoprenylcysteine carboxyl methyltransferase n=1 Tax=Aliiroseovarius crassostreae TaxID=154981 RepID=A0A9Q9HAE1_9RHOB|nr:protein-S-isoprenylcysteine O-methyltransferase [Aliiroseovarius crassostreae]UWP94226.1 hypothetical protein K3X48_08120 [Aliiroseovarius crassostreae]
MTLSHKTAPPRSATSQWTVLLGLCGYFGALYLLRGSQLSRVELGAAAMVATALPMLLHEVFIERSYRRSSSGLAGFAALSRTEIVWARVGVKLIGLAGTLALIALFYWLFPEYHRDFYQPFWTACRSYLPILLALALPYFAVIDARMQTPKDGYFHAGLLFLFRLDRVDRAALRDHALGWLIKAFFLPLMFVYFSANATSLITMDPFSATDSIRAGVNYISRLSLGIDLAFVSIGYVLTLRLTDSHIRSPNPLFWGWVVTLAMYVPFFSVIGRKYLEYNDGIGWLDMFGPDQQGWVLLWGLAIVLSKLLWAWSNMSFGIRFSNLTHRGIITNGPFRWFRHPSYFFKNISWWLLAVPFFSLESPQEALRNSLLLMGINLIYYLRAKAEEAHLSQDPVYVEYALWVEQHGALSLLRKALPFLRYHPPAALTDPVPATQSGQ